MRGLSAGFKRAHHSRAAPAQPNVRSAPGWRAPSKIARHARREQPPPM